MVIKPVILTILTFLINHGLSEPIPFKSCKDGNTVFSVVVTPCNSVYENDWETCVLQHGTRIQVDAVFIAPFSSSSLETISAAIGNGQVIRIPDSGTNPCKGSFIPGCPLTKGKMYIFNRYYNVQKEFPTGSMQIRFAIRDKKTKKVMGCAKVPVIIEKNPKLIYNNEI